MKMNRVFYTCVASLVLITTTIEGGLHSDANTLPFVEQFQDESALCDLCVLLMNRVDIFLHEDNTKQQINKTLYSLCDLVKGERRRECHSAIPFIERELGEHMDPKKVCEEITLCSEDPVLTSEIFTDLRDDSDVDHPRQKRQVLEKIVPRLLRRLISGRSRSQPLRRENSVLCDLCKSVLNNTESAVVDPIEGTILKFIDEICGYLPDPTKEACTDTFNHYIPLWTGDITKGISPEVICTFLRLCSPSQEAEGNEG